MTSAVLSVVGFSPLLVSACVSGPLSPFGGSSSQALLEVCTGWFVQVEAASSSPHISISVNEVVVALGFVSPVSESPHTSALFPFPEVEAVGKPCEPTFETSPQASLPPVLSLASCLIFFLNAGKEGEEAKFAKPESSPVEVVEGEVGLSC